MAEQKNLEISNGIYIVATPIGNLSDITLRALEILRSVDFVVAEDTRTTQKLLNHYSISKPLISYHKYSENAKIFEIKNLLHQGKKLALVSDAGTPGISDPGEFLIKKITEEIPEVRIIPIPGPSALIAAASICGFSMDKFLFLGYPPLKKKKAFWTQAKNSVFPFIIYEAPHHILKTLKELESAVGGEREIFIAKELTKIFEKFYRGKIKDVVEALEKDPKSSKGEYVIIVNQGRN
jgi:16S rRNA (cytidine1402-2'-O)-methyltransferase